MPWEGAGAQVAVLVGRETAAPVGVNGAPRASEERYRRIVELAAEGIWELDADDRTTFVNPTLAVILCEHVSDVSEVRQLGQRLIDAVSAPLELQGREVQIGASIGIALDSTGRELIESVVQDADFALYRAKQNGRGRVELSDPSVAPVPHRSPNSSTG